MINKLFYEFSWDALNIFLEKIPFLISTVRKYNFQLFLKFIII